MDKVYDIKDCNDDVTDIIDFENVSGSFSVHM